MYSKYCQVENCYRKLLTGKLFCWVRNWAAGCPSSPHHHTQLWLGCAACSAPWISQQSSDSCQRPGPGSSCGSGSTPTAQLLRTVNSALSWWTDSSKCTFSSYVLPVSVTGLDHFTLPSVTTNCSLCSSCSLNLMPCRSPAVVPGAVNFLRYFNDRNGSKVTHQRRKMLNRFHFLSLGALWCDLLWHEGKLLITPNGARAKSSQTLLRHIPSKVTAQIEGVFAEEKMPFIIHSVSCPNRCTPCCHSLSSRTLGLVAHVVSRKSLPAEKKRPELLNIAY